MQLGIIGLGRMGSNMAERLARAGYDVTAFDRSEAAVKDSVARGAHGAASLAELVDLLRPRRVVWLMIPAGDPVSAAISDLLPRLAKGDIIVDGGNSNFRDSMARGKRCADQGIHFVDAGTSGGIWGLKEGYCMMVGGDKEPVGYCEPLFKALAPPNGYIHAGPTGAGHYVKMVHNGIEYGLMQAYGEGFELMSNAPPPFGLDLPGIAETWGHASVVRSWLLELIARALRADPKLEKVKGWVEDSGEGRWTVHEAIDSAVPMPSLAIALFHRFRSRQADSFTSRMLAALRNQFGGHATKSG